MKIVCAMSGGVDSSVAALLLQQQGYEVVGVSMQVFDYRTLESSCSKGSCCAPDDFTDARQVAAKIGIPYYVLDLEREFRREVIDPFLNFYSAALTPNPCVECNNKIKFKELRARAGSFGCETVATGHYAKIECAQNGEYQLHRSDDLDKDQTYFLYGLKLEELPKTLFPIGHMTKPEVRELARQYGLVTADKAESQDICFVSGSLRRFFAREGMSLKEGNIIDQAGNIVGHHDGIQNFTVGQRRGIGLGGGEPLYVTEIRAETNEVVVGARESLECSGFKVSELNWLVPFHDGMEVIAQLRHRHIGVPVTLCRGDNREEIKGIFKDRTAVVTPGQIAAFYELNNKRMIGGGRIVGRLGY